MRLMQGENRPALPTTYKLPVLTFAAREVGVALVWGLQGVRASVAGTALVRGLQGGRARVAGTALVRGCRGLHGVFGG